MVEKIICSAIWYIDFKPVIEGFYHMPKNINGGVVVCGHRHSHCISTFGQLTGKRSVHSEVGEITQGFLTNTNRFVDREEGLLIALKANQVINPTKIRGNRLYSEDLY